MKNLGEVINNSFDLPDEFVKHVFLRKHDGLQRYVLVFCVYLLTMSKQNVSQLKFIFHNVTRKKKEGRSFKFLKAQQEVGYYIVIYFFFSLVKMNFLYKIRLGVVCG